MITANLFTVEDNEDSNNLYDLGEYGFSALPRIGDIIEIYGHTGAFALHEVIRVVHFPVKVKVEGETETTSMVEVNLYLKWIALPNQFNSRFRENKVDIFNKEK